MHDLSSKLIETTKLYAEPIAKSKLLRDKLKSFLAVLTLKYLDGNSVSKAETLARASEEYRAYLTAAEKTLIDAEVGRSEIKAIEFRHDYERASEATRRQEMKMS